MPNELIDKLKKLSVELDQTNDQELTDKLKPLIDQVQSEIESMGLEDEENHLLSEVVNEIVTELEVEYPSVTKILADIALKLNSMGI